MKTQRPVYLNLLQFKWPFTAIASITHRLTGVGLFFALAFLLYVLQLATESSDGFRHAGELLAQPLPKLVLLFVLAMLIYHLLAGIKHLLLDMHIGDTFRASLVSAQVVFGLSALLTVAAGVWLW